MATSSITANFRISDAKEARAFVDNFVAAADRKPPRRRRANIAVMSDPVEIRRAFKPREKGKVR